MDEIIEPPLAAPAAPVPPRRRRRWLFVGAATMAGALIVAAALPGAGNGADATVASQVQEDNGNGGGSGGSVDDLWAQFNAWLQQFGLQGPGQDQGGSVPDPQTSPPSSPPSSPQGSTQAAATTASAAESTGVVLINTEIGYGDGQAAGTGMVLTSNGLVLTNNHVVDGSTKISVTDPGANETYTAKVVGTDSKHDVALLQLVGASGLATVAIDANGNEAKGDAITAVGNASGGGVLMAADGTITKLDAAVTTSTNAYEKGETLTGTIEISADVVAGDSGGALLDRQGEVIGMNTAASSGFGDTTAYAIPIAAALKIVDQIRSGDPSGSVTLGYPAFLGVGLSQDAAGDATLGYVYDGTPAAAAGLVAGDTITAVNGKHVADGAALSTALKAHHPGDKVSITWTNAYGDSHTAKVTLAEGPAA